MIKQYTDFNNHRRALDCIAQGSLTNSKRPESYVKGVYPTHVHKGYGCFLEDDKGKKYIDFVCGLGTSLLGYANTSINNAIVDQLKKGSVYSLGSLIEIELAEKIKQIIPFIDVMKFLKTGSEACSAALRIARAKTGRNIVLSHGYHGWADPFVSLSSPALGVPSHTGNILPFTDIELIGKHVAAVIVEPIITDASSERIEFLKVLRQKCIETGALLIFDEVITGFRFPQFTASKFFGITPDIICLGKAIAGGMPLSVVGGKKEVMNCGEYFVSSTFAGETIAMAAAMETITQLQTKLKLSDLFESANMFCQNFNKIAPDVIKIQGYGTRGIFVGDALSKALFMQESCKAGIIYGPSFFFNFCHIELTDQVLSCAHDVLNRIKSGSVKLEGEMPQSPFAQTMRQ